MDNKLLRDGNELAAAGKHAAGRGRRRDHYAHAARTREVHSTEAQRFERVVMPRGALRRSGARRAWKRFSKSAAPLHFAKARVTLSASVHAGLRPNRLPQALALFAATNASSWSNCSDMSPDVEPDSMAASSVSFEG